MNAPLSANAFPPPITDRIAWARAAASPVAAEVIALADKALASETPYVGIKDWEHWWETGERLSAEKRHNQRRYRMVRMTLAAALTGDAKYIPGIEREITTILDEPTWVHCAHDFDYRETRVLDPEIPAIDLFSAMTCQAMAETDAIIGEKLDPALRTRMTVLVRKRGVEFFLARNDYRWETGKVSPNWLAVCAGGVAMAALHLEQDEATLAAVLAKTKRCFDRYFATFPNDGGCLEGLGYWEKSMAYVAMLGDLLERKRSGGWSPLDDPKVIAIAAFPARVALAPGFYPAFSDTGVTRQPQAALLHFLARRLNQPQLFALDVTPEAERRLTTRPTGEQIRDLFWHQPAKHDARLPSTDWLPETEWFIARHPAAKLAIAIKGGSNDEPHNQNDVGSFVIALDGETPIAELGAPAYHRDYFTNDKRYTYLAARSAGHSVPLVNGVEQAAGPAHRTASAARLRDAGSEGLRLDLTPAYPASAGLSRLIRTLELASDGDGEVMLTDHAVFAAGPGELASTLVTHGEIRFPEQGTAVITVGDARLAVSYDPRQIAPRILEDHGVPLRDAPAVVRRLVLTHRPAREAEIVLKFKPVF
ncbi:MAG: heparinase II/III domain-containing protein [Beijerinckiaceae bacterium]